ncbi:MAG: hypothetical protein R3F34_16575 [Planctomycetota bacterium]
MSRVRCELLEPTVAFEVDVPEAGTSGVLADLASRRARIGEVTAEGEWRRIVGEAPLANLAGYSTEVRSISRGRARFNLRPAGFRPVSDAELRARGLIWS